jgi:hypothetical protein
MLSRSDNGGISVAAGTGVMRCFERRRFRLRMTVGPPFLIRFHAIYLTFVRYRACAARSRVSPAAHLGDGCFW